MAGVGFSMLMLIYPMSRPDLTIRHEKSRDVERAGDNGDDISASVSLFHEEHSLKLVKTYTIITCVLCSEVTSCSFIRKHSIT